MSSFLGRNSAKKNAEVDWYHVATIHQIHEILDILVNTAELCIRSTKSAIARGYDGQCRFQWQYYCASKTASVYDLSQSQIVNWILAFSKTRSSSKADGSKLRSTQLYILFLWIY